ncbi:unknown [Bacteroides sp. CAG:714]|nr:unknown [Bacteroides sp. CAG:714]
MFKQAPVSGLAITCVKTVLEHNCFNVVPFVLLFQWEIFYLPPC